MKFVSYINIKLIDPYNDTRSTILLQASHALTLLHVFRIHTTSKMLHRLEDRVIYLIGTEAGASIQIETGKIRSRHGDCGGEQIDQVNSMTSTSMISYTKLQG